MVHVRQDGVSNHGSSPNTPLTGEDSLNETMQSSQLSQAPMTRVSGRKKKQGKEVGKPPLFNMLHDQGDDPPSPCIKCLDLITTEKSIQCDRCKGWMHADLQCANLTNNEFKWLVKAKAQIRFFCVGCNEDDEGRSGAPAATDDK